MAQYHENYFTEKYGMTRPHSEVLNMLNHVPPGRALDLGCVGGRNALWLAAQGFTVTAWDNNPQSLARLREIAALEGLTNISVNEVDLNQCAFDGEYDVILSSLHSGDDVSSSEERSGINCPHAARYRCWRL